MNKTANKVVGIVCAAAMAVVCGCKSVPSIEGMYKTSYAIGYASGMVANETKIDDTSRNTVIEIINIVSACVPETNQTFEAAWMPIAQAHVDKLVGEGKLDEAQGVLVMSAFSLAVKGLDYVFEVRYPKAREYRDLVVSAIDGFSRGFLLVFKPANQEAKFASECVCDQEAYDWLKANR